MTTQVDPPIIDKSRRGSLGTLVYALGSQLRRAATGTPAAAPPTAPVTRADRCIPSWMIKPSTHQKVAIDVHRDDRP